MDWKYLHGWAAWEIIRKRARWGVGGGGAGSETGGKRANGPTLGADGAAGRGRTSDEQTDER